MWLLNAVTLELEYFLEPETHYAILSHTWADEEVLFQDMADHEARGKKKDTLCIDKQSSQDLSEAINSMWRYYSEADVCYAYLADANQENSDMLAKIEAKGRSHQGVLSRCRWFSRGWTLQELLAPRYVLFFDSNWRPLGTKNDLTNEINSCTGIPADVLEEPELVHIYTAAQRMSWVSSRNTTRREDIAYCILGLFGVNMVPIYGEGAEKAFQRLQETILERVEDESLFTWELDQQYLISPLWLQGPAHHYEHNGEPEDNDEEATPGPGRKDDMSWRPGFGAVTGLFASSPQQFLRCKHIELTAVAASRTEPRMTATMRGIEMTQRVSKVPGFRVALTSPYAGGIKFQPESPIFVPLICSATTSEGPFRLILIKDPVPGAYSRFCRLLLPEDELGRLKACLTTCENNTFESRLFVRRTWPNLTQQLRSDARFGCANKKGFALPWPIRNNPRAGAANARPAVWQLLDISESSQVDHIESLLRSPHEKLS